ncbi:MAG: response regulator [Terriglobia bacterium]
MDNKQILIVEDEDKMAAVIADYMKAAGAETHRLADGLMVLDWVKEHQPSAILLDVMLPGCDGLSLCRKIRETSQVPIIMITARASESDRLTGFGVGADDYVCKPFSPKELVARASALLRRAGGASAVPTECGLVLERATLRARANGREVLLTVLEFELLTVLMAVPGRIFSRDEIMDRVYRDFRVVNDRTIDSHIKKLRRKLDILNLSSQPLRSVYGAGYKFELPEQPSEPALNL